MRISTLAAVGMLGAAAMLAWRNAQASTAGASSAAGDDALSGWSDWSDWSEPFADVIDPPAVADEVIADSIDLDAQRGGWLEAVDGWLGDLMPVSYSLDNQNLRAFLAVIRHAEGTSGPNGYRTLFGGALFESFAAHPRTVVTNGRYRSSAAGAYQILARTWDEVRLNLGLSDFSPASQDAAAAWLIKRRGAMSDVLAGRFESAISKVRKEWASLPGAGYGQPEKTLAALRQVYLASGGVIGGDVQYV